MTMEKRNVATSGRVAENRSVEDAIASASRCIAAANEAIRKSGEAAAEAVAESEMLKRAMEEDEKADAE